MSPMEVEKQLKIKNHKEPEEFSLFFILTIKEVLTFEIQGGNLLQQRKSLLSD